MTIREYFDNMITADYDLDEIGELEQTIFHIMEDDYDDFTMWAVENGITSGTSATTFSPKNPCTREQIVTFLYRSMK